MKKTVIILCSVFMIASANYYSFSQKQTNKPAPKAKTTKQATPAAKVTITKAEIEEGKSLVSKSDCLACHQLEVKVVGPSYSMVAEKYPATTANINKLAKKVIEGGAGVWGQIPMNPHPTVSETDAKKMVKYVLSIKAK